jgi:6-phosphogluconate dehydrogenase
MESATYDIGMIGLGVMGRNLVLNMADSGFAVVGYNRHPDKVDELEQEAVGKRVLGVRTIDGLVEALRKPRAVMLMVSAGRAVDQVIEELLPHLDPGDVIIDGGNSHYKDTNSRARALDDKGIQFLGVGISGGEKGARFGPSMMPGGHEEAYARVKPIFEAVAAKADGDPCVTFLGPGSAGHYVKMVHNGIEYGLMQLLAETYDVMRRCLGMTNEQLADVYEEWNRGELQSFLVDITGTVFRQLDDVTGKHLIDLILDRARQKGTGKWTSQDAMDLQVPVPTIDSAVSMRDMSGYKDQREVAAQQFSGPDNRTAAGEITVQALRKAFYGAMIVTYAQGMALLRAASDAYGYGLRLHDVARIWREGCIIRARLLDDIEAAYRNRPDLPNLLLDDHIAKAVMEMQQDVRHIVRAAVSAGVPIPSFMATVGYLDSFRSSRLPANLIQAQRDCFGSHTYERIDREGTFHTNWGAD